MKSTGKAISKNRVMSLSGFVYGMTLVISMSAAHLAQAQSSPADNGASNSVDATKTKGKREPAKPSSGTPVSNQSSDPVQGSVTLDTCFSPGNCDQRLIALIGTAQSNLDVAIYSLTHTGISQAIIDAKNRGVQVRMVVDRSQSKGKSSQVEALVSAGIDLKIGNFKGIMHDKYTIVDGAQMETGSFNYSENATENNGENQLYLNNADVIQRYEQNFTTMYNNGLAN